MRHLVARESVVISIELSLQELLQEHLAHETGSNQKFRIPLTGSYDVEDDVLLGLSRHSRSLDGDTRCEGLYLQCGIMKAG